jgi:hypothetical protein
MFKLESSARPQASDGALPPRKVLYRRPVPLALRIERKPLPTSVLDVD